MPLVAKLLIIGLCTKSLTNYLTGRTLVDEVSVVNLLMKLSPVALNSV